MKPSIFSRDARLVLASIFILLIPVFFGAMYLHQKHQWGRSVLDQLEPRYARLAGLQRQKDELEKAGASARQAQVNYVYPATMDVSQAGNAAQQRVRDIFAAGGMQISSSQVVQQAKDEKGFDRITVNVQADGELLALQSVLAVLGSQTPVIVVDSLNIQLVGGLNVVITKQTPPPRLNTQFSLSVLKDRV